MHSWQKKRQQHGETLEEKAAHIKQTEASRQNIDGADMLQLEKKKIRGAIRTDFILSAEIMVIALDVVMRQSLTMKISVLLIVALSITAGVYGLVAGIVKLDNTGYWLLAKSRGKAWLAALGKKGLISSMPYLMRFLSVMGTFAMFLVGRGILLHNVALFAHAEHGLVTN